MHFTCSQLRVIMPLIPHRPGQHQNLFVIAILNDKSIEFYYSIHFAKFVSRTTPSTPCIFIRVENMKMNSNWNIEHDEEDTPFFDAAPPSLPRICSSAMKWNIQSQRRTAAAIGIMDQGERQKEGFKFRGDILEEGWKPIRAEATVKVILLI